MSAAKDDETSPAEGKKIGVQFYCTEDEAQSIKSAAEKTFRSAASFSKFYTLKAAQAVNEGKNEE
ncbi:MAG: hypothetical protein II649_07000 [Kiritimatiellae bacterium]|nr:hypothetical protein [Kiritimatiellia bacterium]